MNTNIIGRTWRKVKAWALERLHPARVVPPCPRCKRPVSPDEAWLQYAGAVWHIGCIAQARGWKLYGVLAPGSAPEPKQFEAEHYHHAPTGAGLN